MRVGRHELTLEPRRTLPAFYPVLSAVAAIVLALVLASVLFVSADTSVVAAYRVIFSSG